MQPVELKENLFWVGAIDWNMRDFHGYSTPKGTTYNAYLLKDEKITLFDGVKLPFTGELLNNISKIVDPSKIDYLVVNHVEMDHSGAIPDLMEIIKPEKVICSSGGKKALIEHYHREDWPFEVIESGAKISVGANDVQFIETRMLHWPDSMVSYLPKEKLLISSDAFGQHWATTERFDDEVDLQELLSHAGKYYANILMLFSPLVQKLLASVQKMGIEIDAIAPDHGLIWRTNPGRILESYNVWSRQSAKGKAVIIYDTMWQSTEKMAYAIAEGLSGGGVHSKICNLKLTHRSDVMTDVLDARAVILGSPTLNNGMMPTMADMLHYMKGLRPANKLGAAFGSYGWSGEAVKLMTEALEQMKIKVVQPGRRIQFAPTNGDIQGCVEFGRNIAKEIKFTE